MYVTLLTCLLRSSRVILLRCTTSVPRDSNGAPFTNTIIHSSQFIYLKVQTPRTYNLSFAKTTLPVNIDNETAWITKSLHPASVTIPVVALKQFTAFVVQNPFSTGNCDCLRHKLAALITLGADGGSALRWYVRIIFMACVRYTRGFQNTWLVDLRGNCDYTHMNWRSNLQFGTWIMWMEVWKVKYNFKINQCDL